MIICKVIGTVVASDKDPSYEGKKVLLVEPRDPNGEKGKGRSFLAVDAVQAGVGDLVLVAREGNTARQILGDDKAPFHSVITAIIDSIDLI